MSDYERTKMYEDIIARLGQQNAELRQQLEIQTINVNTYMSALEDAEKLSAELRTAFEASRTVSEIQKAMCEKFTTDNVRLFKELQYLHQELDSANDCNTALSTLAEERRVALERCSSYEYSPYEGHNVKRCKFCRCKVSFLEDEGHKPDCDYVRLSRKEDNNGN